MREWRNIDLVLTLYLVRCYIHRFAFLGPWLIPPRAALDSGPNLSQVPPRRQWLQGLSCEPGPSAWVDSRLCNVGRTLLDCWAKHLLLDLFFWFCVFDFSGFSTLSANYSFLFFVFYSLSFLIASRTFSKLLQMHIMHIRIYTHTYVHV